MPSQIQAPSRLYLEEIQSPFVKMLYCNYENKTIWSGLEPLRMWKLLNESKQAKLDIKKDKKVGRYQ